MKTMNDRWKLMSKLWSKLQAMTPLKADVVWESAQVPASEIVDRLGILCNNSGSISGVPEFKAAFNEALISFSLSFRCKC
jgi:hypothetical protein